MSKISLSLLINIIIAIIGYSIYGSRPLVAQPWQTVDDGLYWQQAIQIQKWLSDESMLWLGEYSQIVLTKAPFFPIFLVGVNFSGIPLPVAQFLLLILLAFYFLKALEPVFQPNVIVKAVILLIVVCYPYLPSEVRLVRNFLSSTLTGYFLISLIGLLFRAGSSAGQQALWGGLSGFFLALCYLCREEGAWLAAPALLAVGVLFLFAWQRSRFLQSTAAPASLLVAFFTPVILVCALNYNSYGAFVTTDRRAPQFVKAFKLLASLEPENARRFVPMPEATRRKVYQYSPTFAKLEPHLEGKITDPIASNPGHLSLNGAKPGEREFFVSTFEWGLRSSLWEAGIKTFQDQEKFWESVSNEIEESIVQGNLLQGQKPPALCAPVRDNDIARILNRAWHSFVSLFLLKGANIPYDPRSSGNEADVASMGALTNSQLAPMNESKFRLINSTQVRSFSFNFCNKAVQFFYLIGLVAPFLMLYIFCKGLLIGKIDAFSIQLFVASILCIATLAFFCLMMGVLDVCGWPHLKSGGSYNNLGSMILTIISCVGFSSLIYFSKICRAFAKPLSNSRIHKTSS